MGIDRSDGYLSKLLKSVEFPSRCGYQIQIDLIGLMGMGKTKKKGTVVYTKKKQQSDPSVPARFANGNIASTKDFIFYSLALAPSRSSAPAPVMAGLPVSTTVAWNRTVLPSFHISVLRV